MKYCNKCGNELLDEAVICPKCGCAVRKAEPSKEEKSQTNAKIISIVLIVIGALILLGTFGGLASLF